MGLEILLPVRAIGFALEVAVQLVMAAPLLAPAVKATSAAVEEVTVAVPMVGAAGAAVEVESAVEGDDALLTPTELVQVTVNVYEVAGVRPVTVMGPTPPPVFLVAEMEWGELSAVHSLIACPLAAPCV